DCCDVREGEKVNAKKMYETYHEWAKENGQYLMSSTKFGKEIGMKFTKKKTKTANVYEGITLNDDYYNLNLNF
ncbi:hypothetical protein AAU06_14945, partial [Listeria monocytogenes]|nr:hypothetical protein [Listeria monocytogenes]EAC5660246.1 hypothetical protein [Listeria monocytogenes]EAD0734801.1 hypothetical protein [Listeria monocytogenes]EAD2119335.1 hypothetical protein [Listeria monocytogenes]EAF0052982.1 hypothetical protein [Listeria monocytogenes]